MIKRISGLVIISSLISAGLLFLGTTLIGNFSPALASLLNPLVAGTNVKASSASMPAEENAPLKNELGIPVKKSEVSSVGKAASVPPASSGQPLDISFLFKSGAAPISDVTIAQLLNSPDQFIHKVFTITGIATSLSGEKFLLNDGTGQIFVEVDDHLVKYIITDGQSITVTGKFDDTNSQYGFELDAFMFVDQNGTTFVHDDEYDDDNDDDVDDDADDNVDDDVEDDMGDDAKDDTDDDVEDDTGDDAEDGTDDDAEDDTDDDNEDGTDDDDDGGMDDDDNNDD